MQASSAKRVAVFAVIGLVLVLAVVAGMRWAKERSEYYANKPSPTVNLPTITNPAPASSSPSKPEEKKPEQPAPATATQPPTNTPASQPTPAHVPSTGPEDAVLPIASLSLLAFAAIRYAQARRHLLSLR